MPPTICASVACDDLSAIPRERDDAAGADVVEVRLDLLPRPDVGAALGGRLRPVVITCRPAWEGGGYAGSEEARERVLMGALEAGAEFVDVEWNAPCRDRLLARAAARTIVSWHDFTGMPADLIDRTGEMLRSPAALVKVAVTPARLGDLATLADLGRRFGQSNRLVLVGMGPKGLATRLLASRFGSRWTYAGQGVAPGQVPLSRLLGEFRARRVDEATSVYALVGRPVLHSVSPAMHNAAFDETGIDAVYVPLEADTFDEFLSGAKTLGLRGCSVTAPFKKEAYEASVERDAEARRSGVVNTLRTDAAGQWHGCNTDTEGFLAPIRDESFAGRRVTVVGAGGAARAVARALVDRGAEVTIRARRPEAARAAAERVGATHGPLPVPSGSWDVLVNATPVGTWPDVGASPLAAGEFGGHLVYDLVYNPRETRLVRDARASGCRTVSGLDMLVAQGAAQFEWWTGQAAPRHAMRQAAERRLDELEREAAEAAWVKRG